MFDTIHDSSFLQPVLEQGWTELQLPPAVALKLKSAALHRLQNQDLRMAKLSQSSEAVTAIRNDSIFWLDEEKNLTLFEKELLQSLQKLQQNLKEFLLMPLSDFECHWAYYPKEHFYKRHKDITEKNNRRILSFVLYLNDDWVDDQGGQNVGYKEDQVLWKINPNLGTFLIFRSDIEHEVLPTRRDRLSLTGWFRSL